MFNWKTPIRQRILEKIEEKIVNAEFEFAKGVAEVDINTQDTLVRLQEAAARKKAELLEFAVNSVIGKI